MNNNINKALADIASCGHTVIILSGIDITSKNFIGSDVDILINKRSERAVYEKLKDHKFLLKRLEGGVSRGICKQDSIYGYLDIDNGRSPCDDLKKVNNFLKSKYSSAGLHYLDGVDLYVYKLAKYSSCGYIRSYEQINRLKALYSHLNHNRKNDIEELITELFKKDNLALELHKNIKIGNGVGEKFVALRQKERNKSRIIFKGGLGPKAHKFLFKISILIDRIRYRSFFSLPYIAIVGNDGSGKSSRLDDIIKRYYKFDPLVMDMKPKSPYFVLWLRYRNYLIGLGKEINEKGKNYQKFLWSIARKIFEIFDYIDRLYRYYLVKFYCNSGYCTGFFERYVTDRLRGEFTGIHGDQVPIEAHFPMPDGFVLLDVSERESLRRKPLDGHSYYELNCKRENYLSLIKQMSRYKIVSTHQSPEEVTDEIMSIYFDWAITKQQTKYKYSFPLVWDSNKQRNVIGKKADRVQEKIF